MSEHNNKKTWAIIDVNVEAIEAAKKLAKLEKKNMGLWISDFILNGGKPIKATDAEIIKWNDLTVEIDDIKLALKAIYHEIGDLRLEKHPLPKNNFFNKMFG